MLRIRARRVSAGLQDAAFAQKRAGGSPGLRLSVPAALRHLRRGAHSRPVGGPRQAHVQLLQRRLRELGAGRCEFRPQPALGDRWASGGVFAVWQLDRAALCRMARGRCLRSRTTAFDNAEWSSGHVRCRLKVFPFGLDFGTARSAAADDESPFTVVAEFGCGDFRVDARVCLSSSAEAEAETRHVDLTRPRVVHRTVSWSLPGVVLSALPTGAAEPLELRFAITAGRLVMKTSERSDNDNDYAADSVSSDTGDHTD